jgi:hypothetical protein
MSAALDPNMIYLNGINPETGTYAVPPFPLDDLVSEVRQQPGGTQVRSLQGDRPRSFSAPLGKDLTRVADVGWAVVFPADTSQEIRTALAPLIEHRGKQAGDLVKVLDWNKDEGVRAWYTRHQVSPGNPDPELLPYYLLLVGPPTGIPYDFQYLVGAEYAVGRLAFASAADYENYARSVVEYESAGKITSAREVVYWGTCHPGDPATNLSLPLLVEPLANGISGAAGSLRKPLHQEVGYNRQLHEGEEAVKDKLHAALRRDKPPALLFTASHGMALNAGKPRQSSDQGALLCQDWPGFGTVRPEHLFAAVDVPDDANLRGLVAFFFACFGAGTPANDQFLMKLGNVGEAPRLAPDPFVAALPQRLLSHPRGSALAVIGHIDRAWSFSIQPSPMSGPQIGTFRTTLGEIMLGCPVGHALAKQFGQRYAALSVILLSATSPTAPTVMRLSDRELVTYWLERNDAQDYVLLGDPAVHIRQADLT